MENVQTHGVEAAPRVRKIAILGSAPSSVQLAPYDDQSWEIWGCSPGCFGVAKRTDVFFELHRWEPPAIGKPLDPHNKPWFSPEYVQFLREHPMVFMHDKFPDVPNSVAYPVQEMLDKHGPHYFTSSIAWMIALAIDTIMGERERRRAAGMGNLDDQDKIGLWGVDMAATEEYGMQKFGCIYFLRLAMQFGIAIELPPESDLLRPGPLYGVGEIDHHHVKTLARIRELKQREQSVMVQIQNLNNELYFVKGALDYADYELRTWCGEWRPEQSRAMATRKYSSAAIPFSEGGLPDHPEWAKPIDMEFTAINQEGELSFGVPQTGADNPHIAREGRILDGTLKTS